jgi:hypothetical protein
MLACDSVAFLVAAQIKK